MNDDVLPPTSPGCKPFPVISCDATEAEQAYAVYTALARLSVDNQALGRLPLMIELRRLAYDRFNAAFELMP